MSTHAPTPPPVPSLDPKVYSGQEFARPLKHVPAKTLVKWAFGMLRSRLPESFHADLFGPLPFFLSPLVLSSKVVRCDPHSRGPPPSVASLEFSEDMGAHGVEPLHHPEGHTNGRGGGGGGGGGAPPPSSSAKATKAAARARKRAGEAGAKAREKAFSGPALGEQFFEPGRVYTFDYYDSFFRADKFSLDLKVKAVDLGPMVGDQPLLLAMAKTMDTGEYLWKFEVWHEKALAEASPLFASPRGRGR